jgi:hypothetical protein
MRNVRDRQDIKPRLCAATKFAGTKLGWEFGVEMPGARAMEFIPFQARRSLGMRGTGKRQAFPPAATVLSRGWPVTGGQAAGGD